MKLLVLLLCLLPLSGCSIAQSTSDDGSAQCARAQAETRDSSMSFAELFQLAKGRAWTEEEVQGFQALDQPGKNRVVKELAVEAGGMKGPVCRIAYIFVAF